MLKAAHPRQHLLGCCIDFFMFFRISILHRVKSLNYLMIGGNADSVGRGDELLTIGDLFFALKNNPFFTTNGDQHNQKAHTKVTWWSGWKATHCRLAAS